MDFHRLDSPFGAWLDVFLDDERLPDVLAASEEDGWVDVQCRDAAGQVLLEGRSCYVRRRYHGTVRLVPRPDMPPALRLRYVQARIAEALAAHPAVEAPAPEDTP